MDIKKNRVDEAIGNAEERNNLFKFESVEEITNYRVTGIQLAIKCGVKFRQDFVKGPGQHEEFRNKYLTTGSLVHLLLEDEMLAFAGQERFLSFEDKDRIRETLGELQEGKTLNNLYSKFLPRFMQYLFACEIIGIEQDFTVPNNQSINLGGHADLVLKDNNTGLITIVDFKTHRRPKFAHEWESSFQCVAYGNAACQHYGVDSVRFIIGCVNLDEDAIFTIKRSPSAVNLPIRKALRNIDDGIAGQKTTGDHCRGCNFTEKCESHRKMKELGR